MDHVRHNSFWEVAAVEGFGSVLPQILFFVQSNSERLDRLFTCGIEWGAQFPLGFAWHKLMRHAVFEPLFKPETLKPNLQRTYDIGLTAASLLPVTGFVYYLTSLRNTLRAKVLHQNSYVGAIGLDKKAGTPREKISKEDETAAAKKNWSIFAKGEAAFLGAGLLSIPATALALKKGWALPEVTWKLKQQLPDIAPLGKWYQGLQQSLKQGVEVKPLDFLFVENGDLAKLSPLQEAASVGMPSYAGYLRFAQDKLEVGDIIPRIVTYALAVPFGPSAVLDKPWAKQPFEGKQFPILGDGKNVQLLLRLGLSCLVYTGLPQAYTLLTRQKRAEKAGLLPARSHSVIVSPEQKLESPTLGIESVSQAPTVDRELAPTRLKPTLTPLSTEARGYRSALPPFSTGL
ncbi:MAG: hypothetical protein ACKO34_04635 [Vampirovibrionales bacterium]